LRRGGNNFGTYFISGGGGEDVSELRKRIEIMLHRTIRDYRAGGMEVSLVPIAAHSILDLIAEEVGKLPRNNGIEPDIDGAFIYHDDVLALLKEEK
jgi:uncharacterized protein (DUF2164 family)